MRRVVATLSVVAIVLWAVSSAWAAPIDYIGLGNLENANWTADEPLYGPTAATGGVYWLDTGTGPVPLEQDINLEFLGSTTQNGAYVDLIALPAGTRPADTPALFLLSLSQSEPQSARGWNIVAAYGPRGPGNPHGTNGCQGVFMDPAGDSFGIPGVVTPSGQDEWVKIRAWTGDFSTYAAAQAGGAYTGEVKFQAFFANMLSFPTDMAGMPAMVLRATPEPSTLVLMGAGTLGLLVYGWRKRK